MSSRTKKPVTATITPGRNAPVDNVVRLEDLLRDMATPPPRPARGAGAIKAPSAMQAQVLDLASRLRAARAAAVKPGAKRR